MLTGASQNFWWHKVCHGGQCCPQGVGIHPSNVLWHQHWTKQGQKRWRSLAAISLENHPRFVGGGQGTSIGRVRFRETACPAEDNTNPADTLFSSQLGASHRIWTWNWLALDQPPKLLCPQAGTTRGNRELFPRGGCGIAKVLYLFFFGKKQFQSLSQVKSLI